jgi:hypothetical protein
VVDKEHALRVLRARAQTIKDICAERKIDPDALTAAAFVYNAMKLLKLPADDIFDGHLALAMQAVLTRIEESAAGPKTNVTDPDAEITLTAAQLAQLMGTKIGNA